ncbi:MAG: cytochrome P450 [Cyanobacteria bacterium P01_G01_bin.19]
MKTIPTIESTSGWLRTVRQINALFRPLGLTEQRSRKYGDFYQITFKNAPPTIVTSNPKAIADVFTASPTKFEVGRGNRILSLLVGDNSLLLLDGSQHKNRRRLLMPPFHGESLKECKHKIVEITQKVSDRLQVNRTFNVRALTQEITMRVILSVVFGIDSGDRCDHLRRLLTNLLETFNNPLNSSLIFFPILQKDWGKFSPWGRFLLLQQEIRALIYAEIKDRRELLAAGKLNSKDIFSLLLLAKDEQGVGMTDDELHDELITLLFAGHETTASALSWVFYWVHYLPEVRESLNAELNNNRTELQQGNTNNLPYLNAVISETLRIYPIAASTFPRIFNQDINIMGYDIDPQTWLIVSIYALHHREDLYPNPKQFDPQRFLDRTYSSYEYVPFGGGNRRCIGSALALQEMKLVTATILSEFQLELVKNSPMQPVRRGLTIAPPASFKMRVQKRLT